MNPLLHYSMWVLGVVWRIIIFKKGPLAAIVLLITAVLGVLKLFWAK